MGKVGIETFRQWMAVRRADIKAHNPNVVIAGLDKIDVIEEIFNDIINTKEPFGLKDLAVNGHDVMGFGFTGVRIGQVLRAIMDFVTENPESNNKQDIENFIRGQVEMDVWNSI